MKIGIIAFMALYTASAFAGGDTGVGNGGGVWTCRSKGTHELRWVQLVDLFEARNEFQLNIPFKGDLSMEALIDAVERKIFRADKDYYAAFEEHLDGVRARIKFIDDTELTVINDSLYRGKPAPETCKRGDITYEQLGNYTTDDRLIVDNRLWTNPLFKEVDKAAFYVHEALYSLLRQKESVTDSTKARKIVGYLFSDKPVAEYQHLLTLPTPPAPEPVSNIVPTFGVYKAQSGNYVPVTIYFDASTNVLTSNETGTVGKFTCYLGTDETICEGQGFPVQSHRMIWRNGGFYWISSSGSTTWYSKL